jgi:hypothetical protein
MKRVITKNKFRDAIGNILLFTASTSMCLIGTEAALRLFPQYNDNMPVRVMGSEFSSYRMVPNQSMTSLHGKKYNINSLGLRDEEIESPYGEIFALLLGDSSTMGYGVQESERFSNLLSKKISNKNSFFKEIGCFECESRRFLNAGHAGYSAVDNLGMLNYLLNLGIKPRMLIVGVMNNDFSYPLKVTTKRGTTLRSTNVVMAKIEVFLKNIFRNSASYQYMARSLKKIFGIWSLPEDTNNIEKMRNINEVQLNAYKNLLARFGDSKNNSPILFVFIPEDHDLDAGLSFSMKLLKKEIENQNCAAFVDPTEQLLSSGQKRINLYALNDPHHPSALGHRIISDTINQEISKLFISCSNS